jgi:heterodisulfide reductase subunit D
MTSRILSPLMRSLLSLPVLRLGTVDANASFRAAADAGVTTFATIVHAVTAVRSLISRQVLFKLINFMEVDCGEHGLDIPDLYKRLLLMEDDAIVTDTADLI